MNMRLDIIIGIVLVGAAFQQVTSFLHSSRPLARSSFILSITNKENNEPPKRSRLGGNQRAPTAQELAVMDEMISKLANAKPYELPNAVRRAFRVISSPVFFLRIAELTDQASDANEKEKLSALASNLISTVEAVVSTTQDKLDESAKDLESVVKAAAEPDSGEFLVPLLPERVQSMRDVFNKLDDSQLDEGFLSTVDAWMNKSYKDGMDLMVGILQKVLQMYAGRKIGQALSKENVKSENTRNLFIELLEVDAERWDDIIRQGINKGVSVDQIQSEVQSNMESIVLSLETGSLSQRVQAEYLKEISKRIDLIQRSRD